MYATHRTEGGEAIDKQIYELPVAYETVSIPGSCRDGDIRYDSVTSTNEIERYCAPPGKFKD